MEENTPFESRIDLSELKSSVEKIKTAIGQIIVGQERMIDLLLMAILADGHVLIEGVPGVAKTLTAKIMAKIVDADFSRIQFTPDLMPSDVLGTSVFNLKDSSFEFKEGPIFSNIVLIDEINRAPAKTQAALFEVMEERQITVDGHCYRMEEPFLVLATQNPIEQEGTYRLPEAQLDRFLFKISVHYPQLEEEIDILKRAHQHEGKLTATEIPSILSKEQIIRLRKIISSLHIDDKLLAYIAQIVNKTREDKALYLGASPRASLAILNSAKALAAMQGRDFVNPEDINEVAPAVLNHRIILTPEKEMEGVTILEIIRRIIQSVEVPR